MGEPLEICVPWAKEKMNQLLGNRSVTRAKQRGGIERDDNRGSCLQKRKSEESKTSSICGKEGSHLRGNK